MPEQQVEPEVTQPKDLRSLEASLQLLWEKARRVSEVILQLKEANQQWKGRVAELEQREQEMKAALEVKEKEVERLRHDVQKLQMNGSEAFTKEEREAMKARIKELIAKINARL